MGGPFFVIASTTGWIGATLLLVIYHRSARWWKTSVGRALFFLILVSFSFFCTSMLYNVFGEDYPGRTAMRFVNMIVSVSMVWYLLGTMVVGGARRMRDRRLRGILLEPEEFPFPPED